MEHVASLLPLAMALGTLAALMWLLRWRAGQRRVESPGPRGVGGWLRAFIILMLFVSPLINISTQLRNFSQAEARNPAILDLPGYMPYQAFSWMLLAALLAWQCWAANRLRTHFEPQSVVHIKRCLVGGPVLALAGDMAGFWLFVGLPPGEETLRQLPSLLFHMVLWYWYFSVSKRVQNTYFTHSTVGATEPRRRYWGAGSFTPAERQEPVLVEAAPEGSSLPAESVKGTAAPEHFGECAEPASPRIWWYADGAGQRHGPVSLVELGALADSGNLGHQPRAWREGMLAWKPIAEILQPVGTHQDPIPQVVEPSFVQQARLRSQTASSTAWVVAVVLAILLVTLCLALYLPERVSLAYALGTGIGALLLPALVTWVYSVASSVANQKKGVRVFAGCCALLVAVNGTGALVSRGYLQRLIDKDGMTAEDFTAQAAKCARLGDLRCQEASWRETIRLLPEDAVAIARLGIVLNQRGKHEEAIVQFKRAIELGAGAYDLFAYYADSHEKQGHTADAIEWSYKTLSVAPDLVDVRARLARLLTKAQRPYEALSLLQAYDSQRGARGGQPYFTAQRISIETAIDLGETGRSGERLALRLPMYGGHFYAPVTFGAGKPLPFMVDTGASVTTLSDTLLRESKAGYRITDPQVKMRTADGRITVAKGILIESMKVGSFELKNVPALVCADCASLLGQASLRSFDMQSARTQGVEFLLLAKRGT